jgi:hypothetical protein
MRIFIFTILCWGIGSLYGQSAQTKEHELLTLFKKISYQASYKESDHANDRQDSIKQANKAFREALLAYTATSRNSITYEFQHLQQEGLIIKTSHDGLFRIYSWDTQTGGAGHTYNAIFQYKTDNKVNSKLVRDDEEDAGRWYSHIYTLKTDNKTYYIGLYHEVYSARDLFQGVKLFCIENNDLNDTVCLFKTKTGMSNELGFEFDLSSVINRTEYPVKLIYYEEDEDKLQLAVVSNEGKVTNRFVTFLFTGKYFERVGRE